MTQELVEPLPFHNQDVEDIHLSRAPLVRVFAQIRWQEITALKSSFGGIADSFALAILDDYPYSSSTQEINILITPEGPQQQPGGAIVQYRSADEDWRAYLSQTFLTLETTNYDSLDDFCSRFTKLVAALSAQVRIPAVSRIGFRYVDRVSEPADVSDLQLLVRAEVRGGEQVPIGEPFKLQHSITESLFLSEAGSLITKWATLPAGASLDPSIEPASDPSWNLDLDAFHEANVAFNEEAIVSEVRSLAHLGYTFFRWAVLPEFLTRFGAEQ